ncbi:TPA: hypothetical protein ACGW7B_002250 [Bacillus nitratireducens]|uniref:hypothetical protein n=1 Tax=Bacillus wiedmannii TaxID=1890302 RepID=UPI000BF23B09|nr:hypothetical protein [Bacillus wiedmannii]PEI76306.1 hypothetical protein CN905_17225 [Bacillus wiedmannii]
MSLEEILTEDNLQIHNWKVKPNIKLLKRIIEEKEVIDPLIWVLKIEEQVHIEYEKYIEAMEERHKENPKALKKIQQAKQF